jgi:hypothetical protein
MYGLYRVYGVLRIDGLPSDMEASSVLGQARGRDEDNLPPDAKAARDRGRSLFGEGKWLEAAEAFSEAINAAPSAHLLLTNRALCNQKLERYSTPHPKTTNHRPFATRNFQATKPHTPIFQALCNQKHEQHQTRALSNPLGG